MLIQEFEKELKKFDEGLNIRMNKNSSDIAGIYWNDIYVGIAVPPKEIWEEVSDSYQDEMGYPYHSMKYVREMLPVKLAKVKKMFEEDPEIFK